MISKKKLLKQVILRLPHWTQKHAHRQTGKRTGGQRWNTRQKYSQKLV